MLVPRENPSTTSLQELTRTYLWVHQKFCCQVKIVAVLVSEYREATTCISCAQQNLVDACRYYCAQCGRHFVNPIKKSTIPILVSDGECSAKMLIRCRELKELTENRPMNRCTTVQLGNILEYVALCWIFSTAHHSMPAFFLPPYPLSRASVGENLCRCQVKNVHNNLGLIFGHGSLVGHFI